MSFVEKVEPYILSNDKHVREFALEAIETSYLGTETSFLNALEAMDKLPAKVRSNPIIPFTRNFPITERVLLEVIRRIEKQDENFIWYTTILEYTPTDLLEKYQGTLEKLTNKAVLQQMTKPRSMDSEALFMEVAGVMNALKKDEYNHTLFLYGKRIFRELINHGEYEEDNFADIEHGITPELNEEFFSMNGIYNVFIAGEQQVQSLVPTLASLLVRTEEDLLMEEVVDALIKIGTEEVLTAVEKYIQNEDTAFAAIEIIANIKLPAAEAMLLQHLDVTTDQTTKTLIAEALCLQLSIAAIPKIAVMLEAGFDETILDLREVLYPTCIMNEIGHPNLQIWKQHLTEMDHYWKQQQKKLFEEEAKSKGVGRNDPCICGSGKKFKNCCGA